jgi:hypothetical protein
LTKEEIKEPEIPYLDIFWYYVQLIFFSDRLDCGAVGMGVNKEK